MTPYCPQSAPYVVKAVAKYSFARIEIKGDKLILNAIESDGTPIEKIEVNN
jgi:hypothetical protein